MDETNQACGFKFPLAVSDSQQATEDENSGGSPGQDGPPGQELSNATLSHQSHKFTDRDRRTGLKTADRHASWSEVYRECGVEGWRP